MKTSLNFPKGTTRFATVAADMGYSFTAAQARDARYLERRGFVFLVHFGLDIVCEKAREARRQRRAAKPKSKASKAHAARKRTAWGAYLAARHACRLAVIARDGQRCRICRKHGNDVGYEVHEVIPRSLGGDPTNPDDCVLVCGRDHRDLTANRTSLLIVDPGLKAAAKLQFFDAKGEPRYV
jgi:hypothetical protein